MDFSIIIPIYNGEKYIDKCLKSILDCHYKSNLEIILVNDGSTDSSKIICERYSDRYQNVILIDQKNKGLSAARNSALEVAKGKFIVFSDIDDWISENCLDEIYDKLKNNNLDILVVSVDYYNNKYSKLGVLLPLVDDFNDILSGVEYIEKYGLKYQIPVWNYIFKRSFLIENEFSFVEGYYHEDCEFISKVFYKCHRIGFTKNTVYNHLNSDNSIMRSKNIKKAYDLVEISRLVERTSNESSLYSGVVKLELKKYAGFLAFSSIKSCVDQGFSIKNITKKRDYMQIILRNLKYNKRYSFIGILLKFNLDFLVVFIIKLVNNLRGMNNGK